MAEKQNADDFEFEIEGEENAKVAVEVEDDTPEEDRNRGKLPQEIVDELEADELEDYSEKVKQRLKQMKRVWHDERREKERLQREQQEALRVAQRLLEENKKLKSTVTQGEKTLVDTYKQTVEHELTSARRAYKEAYEAGDGDKLVEAQEKLALAQFRMEQVKNYKPSLQDDGDAVTSEEVAVQTPRLDPKTVAWQERNKWWGQDEEMTASALGLHQKLIKQYGGEYVGTDEYWQTIDTTMRRRFPEYFGEQDKAASTGKSARETKQATVVAPASRSTSSKKIVLKQSQIAIARKLGLTPEQYAKELAKMQEN